MGKNSTSGSILFACSDFDAYAHRFFNFENLGSNGALNPLVAGEFEKHSALKAADNVDGYNPLSMFPVEMKGKNKEIAIVKAVGAIVPGSMPSFLARIMNLLPLDNLIETLSFLVDNSKVACIILQFDSPGGQINQIDDAYSQIREMRKKKKIIAFASQMATSGAFWLACACDKIIMCPSGCVGSIGIVSALVDDSVSRGAQGIYRVIETSTGADEKVTDAKKAKGLSRFVEEIDYATEEFYQVVARFLNIGRDEVVKKYGNARTFYGQEAKDNGIINEIMYKTDLINNLQEALDAGRRK